MRGWGLEPSPEFMIIGFFVFFCLALPDVCACEGAFVRLCDLEQARSQAAAVTVKSSEYEDAVRVQYKRAYENPFLQAKDIHVTAQLVKEGQCYSARWNVGSLYTVTQVSGRNLCLSAETVWLRMDKVFFACLDLETVLLGQRFYSESLDTTVPALINNLRACARLPLDLECCQKKTLSYDVLSDKRLTYAHVDDLTFEGRRLWSVCRIPHATEESRCFAAKVVRFVVPEAGLMLEGVAALPGARERVFDLDLQDWS